MARGFKSTLRGYAAHLETAERDILRTLFSDVISLLGGVVPDGVKPVKQTRPKKPRAGDFDLSQLLGRSQEHNPSTSQHPTSPEQLSDEAVDAAFWQLVDDVDTLEEFSRTDPAVQKLLPEARIDDAEGAEQFAELAGNDIRLQKIEDLQRAIGIIHTGSLLLNHTDALAFSRALNSVRLVLATRLGIEDEQRAKEVNRLADVDQVEDVETYMALLYNFVSWLLETLMTAMIGDLR